MGNLTDDMTRLRGEVEILRGSRDSADARAGPGGQSSDRQLLRR